MDWSGGRESGNVEDQRGFSPAGLAIGGGGIGTILLVLLFLVMGGDPSALFQQGQGRRTGDPRVQQNDGHEEPMVKFVRVILASTEDVWHEQFRRMGWGNYREPKLVLFNGRVRSACGLASAAIGPFYCPPDEHVYLDLSFFNELKTRFHAGGDFANGYVIAHEVGHHVQKLRGISGRVDAKRRQVGKAESNRLSVRLELQADFLAGVWGHYVKQKFKISRNDRATAINTAAAIGDDRLQMESQGYVVPDSFTHGRADQRVKWFERGYESGDPSRMDDLFRLNYNEL